MTWMLTATGALVDLDFIASDAIDILDIAHHLSQINRFTGACRRPYSVAEHSLLVCDIIERECGATGPSILLAALLHDAHEAYTTDLSSPMKQVVGPAWASVEDKVQRAVQSRFSVITASVAARLSIKRADMLALSTERSQLLPDLGPEWQCTKSHPPLDWVDLNARQHFTWQDWRTAFLDRFGELNFARDQAVANAPF